MAAPVPFRTKDDKYTPSFPPVVYYRDTFGFDRETDGSDNDSITTKSTVRTTMNIYPVPMNESTVSRVSNLSQSYHVEQVTTTHILTKDAPFLFKLAIIAFASALQLLIFTIISIFYDGCPLFIGIVVCCLLIIDSLVILIFTKLMPTLQWLKKACIAAAISFFVSLAFCIWTAYLINAEDKFLENIGHSETRITTSTRIAIYTLQMICGLIHGIVAGFALYNLYNHLRGTDGERITHAYFLSEPQLGHQKILVPINLRQVRESSDQEPDRASIGVQTSGSRHQD